MKYSTASLGQTAKQLSAASWGFWDSFRNLLPGCPPGFLILNLCRKVPPPPPPEFRRSPFVAIAKEQRSVYSLEQLSYHKGFGVSKERRERERNPKGAKNSRQQHTIYGRESKTAQKEQKVWALGDRQRVHPVRVSLSALIRKVSWGGGLGRGRLDKATALLGSTVVHGSFVGHQGTRGASWDSLPAVPHFLGCNS